MRRGITLIAAGLLLFAGAAFGGFFVAARLAPDLLREQVELHATQALGAQVHFQKVEIALGLVPPAVTIFGAEARAVFGDGSALEAGGVRATVNPVLLLVGSLEVGRVDLDDATLWLARGPEARARAPAHGFVETLGETAEALRGIGDSLAQTPCSWPDLGIRGGRVLQAPSGKEPDVLLAEGVSGKLTCGLIRGRLQGHLAGRLATSRRETAAANVTLSVGGGRVDVEGRLPGLPVAAIPGVQDAKGRLDVSFGWTRRSDGRQRLDVTASGRDVAGGFGSGPEPVHLALREPVLKTALSLTRGELMLEEAELADQKLTLSAHGSLGLPPAPDAKAALDVTLARAEMTGLSPLLDQLKPSWRKAISTGLSHVERGTIEHLRVAVDTTLAGFDRIARDNLLARPGDLLFEASVRGANVRLSPDALLEDVTGSLKLADGRVELRTESGRYAGDPLPRLTAHLSGLERVPTLGALGCEPPSAVPALPGLPRLRRWILSRRKEKTEDTWQRVQLDVDHAAHPILFCVLRDAAGSVRPIPGGLGFDLERGVWGSLPISGEGSFVERDGGSRVEATLRIAEPLAEAPPALEPGPWMAGRFRVDARRMGDWHIRGASGEGVVEGGVLHLADVTLLLDPNAQVEGDLDIDLGHPDSLPFRTALELTGARLEEVAAATGAQRTILTGALYGAGAVEGTLVDRDPPLAHASGWLSLNARDGVLAQRIPLLFAIATTSPLANPFRGRDEIPYDAIDLVARVGDGWLRTDHMIGVSPRLRVAITGGLDVRSPHELDGVAGVFFFPTIDSLIDKLPILNRVILGPDRNLVGAYFALRGTWAKPRTSLLPSRSLVAMPVIDGLSSFLVTGYKTLESVIAPAPETPPEASSSEAPKLGS